MIQFPLTDLLDEHVYYNYLVRTLHPTGLHCPQGCPLPPEQASHDRHRAPIVEYR